MNRRNSLRLATDRTDKGSGIGEISYAMRYRYDLALLRLGRAPVLPLSRRCLLAAAAPRIAAPVRHRHFAGDRGPRPRIAWNVSGCAQLAATCVHPRRLLPHRPIVRRAV